MKNGIRYCGTILLVFSTAFFMTKIGLAAYVLEGTVSTGTASIVESDRKCVCYVKETGNYYTSINGAVKDITSGNIYVIPGSRFSVDEDTVIPSGVNLYIPYQDETWNADKSTWEALGTTYSDSASSTPGNLRSLISFVNGASLTIESGGAVYLGGQFKTYGISGLYSEIRLGVGSSITVGGTFYAYGYVKEYGTATNATLGSMRIDAADDGRFIEVLNGGSLYTCFGIYDMKSGNPLTILSGAGICPISRLDFPNLQTYTKVNYGGTMTGVARVAVAGQNIEKEARVVSTSTSTSNPCLFILSSGYIGIEYVPQRTNLTTTVNGHTYIYVGGTASLGYVIIEEAGTGINTSETYLPMSHKFHIRILSGGTFTSNYQIKFLPGSDLTIDEGGTFNMNSNLIFYRSEDLNGIAQGNYVAGQEDAKFINNGTLKLGSSATMGGFVETTSSNGNAKVDLTSVTSWRNLMATSYEGTSETPIIVQTSGLFENVSTSEIENGQFAVTKEIYSSTTAGANCWAGDYAKISQIDVTIINPNNWEYLVTDYVFYISESSSGTNEMALTDDPYRSSGTFQIPANFYFRVVISNRILGAEFADTSTYGSFSSGTRYLSNGDATVNINPYEGKLLTITSESRSGAGSTKYEVFESLTQNGSYTSLIEIISGGSIIVRKDAWYYIKFTGGFGTNGTTEVREVRDTDANGAVLSFGFGSSNKHQMTDNLSIWVGLNASCILPGTLITMGDGTRKPVEDVHLGDMIMSYDLVLGAYVPRPVVYYKEVEKEDQKVVTVIFDDGTRLKTCGGQGYFDLEELRYFVIEDFDASYIGKRVMGYQDGKVVARTIVSIKVETVETLCYELVTAYSYNFVADGILTVEPLIGSVNLFKVGEDLRYDQAAMLEDINTYGLYTLEDVSDFCSPTQFELYNVAYLKVAVGKGLLTREGIKAVVERYRKYSVS